MPNVFLAAQNDTGRAFKDYEPESWKPIPHFFYGTLMDEGQLTSVLNLTSPPILRPALIVGYSIKMWGPFPTLVEGPPGNIISGMVYEVQSEADEKKLAHYESSAYRSAPCSIRPAGGGEEIYGKTFVWARDPNDQNLSPGIFDLEEWKKLRYGRPQGNRASKRSNHR